MFISFNNSWMNESSDQSLCECWWEARCTAGVVDNILLLLICHFNARHVFEKEMTRAGGSSCCTSAFPKLFVKMGHLRLSRGPAEVRTLTFILQLKQARVKDLFRLFWVSREVPTVCYQRASKGVLTRSPKFKWMMVELQPHESQMQSKYRKPQNRLNLCLEFTWRNIPKSHFTLRIISCVVLWHYDSFSIVLKAFNANCF